MGGADVGGWLAPALNYDPKAYGVSAPETTCACSRMGVCLANRQRRWALAQRFWDTTECAAHVYRWLKGEADVPSRPVQGATFVMAPLSCP